MSALATPLLETRFVYEPKSERYLLTTFLDGKPFGTPLPYTFAEYLRYQSLRGQGLHWDSLNAPTRSSTQRTSKPIRRGVIDRIFGPGGLRLKLQGHADLSAGGKTVRSDNPALPQARASRPTSTSRRRSRLVCRLRSGQSSRRG